jgi:hypothetical protein
MPGRFRLANGVVTTAGNLLGHGNTISSQAPFPNTTLSLAFNLFGDNTIIPVGPGAIAIAGAIAQILATITRSIPGININELVNGRASVIGSEKPAPAAAARSSRTEATTPTPSVPSRNPTTTSPARGVDRRKATAPSRHGVVANEVKVAAGSIVASHVRK